ncbi:MAG: CBS domain-containing protein [Saprospiraceae bacterium]|nr:CBS domain-containing protein [Saprospiraceae bacterium]
MNPERPVREIMTTSIITVSPDTSVREIQNLFQSHNFHHLPVVDSGSVLKGIISKEDFFKLSYVISLHTTGKTWSEKEYKALKAADIMTKFPLVLDPDDSIGLAADIFLANRFHSLPIVEEDRLIGIVTTHDLLLYSFNSSFIEKETGELI